MKKTLLTVALLLAAFTQAQEVSPYYPAKYYGEKGANFMYQLTYMDMNFITNNVSDFIMYGMNMGIEKIDDTKFSSEGGSYTVHYTEQISQTQLAKMSVTYNIGKVDDVYVIMSAKIAGNKDKVLTFFINFWESTIHEEGKNIMYRRMAQDVAKYYLNKGKPYIIVTNSTFDSLKEFQDYFKELKVKAAE